MIEQWPDRAVPIFLRRVSQSSERILCLDYDGTLAPFQLDPEQAFPYSGMVGVLSSIMEEGSTRVVIVSGRAIESLLPLLDGLAPLPEMWGAHGFERRHPDGRVESHSLPDAVAERIDDVKRWVHTHWPIGRYELKPASVALHWRGMDPTEARRLESAARRFLLSKVSDALGLTEFDGGLELRARGFDKGGAVRTLLAEAAADAAIAYAGDDLTDEDAFEALGDRGLSILVRPEPRTTAANVWLRPPDELVLFLRDWLDACTKRDA